LRIRTARILLSITWVFGIVPLFLGVALEAFLQVFGKGIGSDKGLVWFVNLVFPILGTIVGSWTVGKNMEGDHEVASPAVFWMSMTLLIVYLAILWMAFLVATFVYGNSSEEWDYIIQSSGWFLGLLQGTIGAVLAKFFIENIQPSSGNGQRS
jgi:hypothetical protein